MDFYALRTSWVGVADLPIHFQFEGAKKGKNEYSMNFSHKYWTARALEQRLQREIWVSDSLFREQD